MQPRETHGAFSWNELITTDLESARAFYGRLFGWTFVESETIYGNTYLVAFKGQDMVGGMMLKDGNVAENVAPCWDPYVTVDDVDASAKEAVALGGELLVPPTDIPNVGRFCAIRDPQGIALNLVTYARSAGE
ncbi:VOC family protein [Pseudodesulfovibrio karagichevae]|uniref:VOC family protein n=1 Tax=Pseudodesulfovibrio karagichevae TaxID=3239305 RepID=A0ABV4JZC1_9BACT